MLEELGADHTIKPVNIMRGQQRDDAIGAPVSQNQQFDEEARRALFGSQTGEVA